MTHKSKLGYTQWDDGVHLTCTCGWEKNLGFSCGAADAYNTWMEHARLGRPFPPPVSGGSTGDAALKDMYFQNWKAAELRLEVMEHDLREARRESPGDVAIRDILELLYERHILKDFELDD